MLGTLLGNYRVVERLGEGGMGVVYVGRHESLGRRVVVKVLRPELSKKADMLKRFFNEAQAATAINNAGIAQVFDFGTTSGGQAYFVMELLQGETLTARLKQGRLDAVECCRLGRQIANVLAAAHAAGITHRDLKPDNLFLVPDAEVLGGERVKVLDFGIAKLTGDAQAGGGVKTQAGLVMGTPSYMAPEQCLSARDADARSDIYALGCILFRMLCGRPPFIGPTVGDIVAAQVGEEPPLPEALAPGIPPRLSALILKMLEKHRAARPQTMAAVGHALDELLRELGEPTVRSSSPAVVPVRVRASSPSIAPRLPGLPPERVRGSSPSIPPPMASAPADSVTPSHGSGETTTAPVLAPRAAPSDPTVVASAAGRSRRNSGAPVEAGVQLAASAPADDTTAQVLAAAGVERATPSDPDAFPAAARAVLLTPLPPRLPAGARVVALPLPAPLPTLISEDRAAPLPLPPRLAAVTPVQRPVELSLEDEVEGEGEGASERTRMSTTLSGAAGSDLSPRIGGRRTPVLLGLAFVGVAAALALVFVGGAGRSADGEGAAQASGPAAPVVTALVEPPPPVAPGGGVDPQLADAVILAEDVEARCRELERARKWRELGACAEQLAFLDAGRAAPLRRQLAAEQLRADAPAIDRLVAALGQVKDSDCEEYRSLLAQARGDRPARIVDEAARRLPCVVVTKCDAEALLERGRAQFAISDLAAALATYRAAHACRPGPDVLQQVLLVACNLRDVRQAKAAWRALPVPYRTRVASICVRNGISEEALAAP